MDFNILYNIEKIFRINHYLKNLIIFIPIFFLPNFPNLVSINKLLLAFLSFSLISSAVYLSNDIYDIESDKKHPIKKFRPLASGIINKTQSFYIILILVIVSIFIARLINIYSIILIITYFFMNILYSSLFKKIPFLGDVCIALGFVFRVLIGYFIFVETGYYEKKLLYNIVMFIFFTVLFFTLCKRKLEIKFNKNNKYQGKFLLFYNNNLYNIFINIARIFSYIFYLLLLLIVLNKDIARISNILLFLSFIVYLLILSRFMKMVDKNKDDNITAIIYNDKKLLLYIFFNLILLLGYFFMIYLFKFFL